MGNWVENCEFSQEVLWKYFFCDKEKILHHQAPVREEESFVYWWHAHALDVLLDGYLRSGNDKYLIRFNEELEGTLKANNGTFLHNWYDDMEWMTLALIRAFDITKKEELKEHIFGLWEDIKTAWNEQMGGGMAWKKDQLDYKNTPANAPAAIVAFRLYQRFGRQEDFVWGKKIFEWNKENLMDPVTCFVWDGLNRNGDGLIDYDWKFTYCQGVMIGAALEYYKITKEQDKIDLALLIARTANKEFGMDDAIFPYEGPDDCGLFRGIYFRYLYELIVMTPDTEDLKNILLSNASKVKETMYPNGLIGGDWKTHETGEVDLAQHLSGIMLLEMADKIGKQQAPQK